MCGTDCFLMLLSVLFPPIGVWVKRGICGADSLINLALCCLGFLPGLLHAWYIILKYPDAYEYESMHPNGEDGSGTVTYYYVAQSPAPRRAQQGGYGTVAGSQPASGQFPGQQSGSLNSFPQPKTQAGAPKQQQQQPQGGSSSQTAPEGNPPTYADAIRGDHKVQGP